MWKNTFLHSFKQKETFFDKKLSLHWVQYRHFKYKGRLNSVVKGYLLAMFQRLIDADNRSGPVGPWRAISHLRIIQPSRPGKLLRSADKFRCKWSYYRANESLITATKNMCLQNLSVENHNRLWKIEFWNLWFGLKAIKDKIKSVSLYWLSMY